MSIIEDVILSAPRVKNTARYIPTSKMKLHPSNPRFIKDRDFDILCQSIKNNLDFFEARPLLCTPDLVVFAGNMRLRAAKALKLKHVPVIIMDVDEEKQRELMIRDNVNNGQWDTDALAAMFEIPELAAWGMPEFVFNEATWESDGVEHATQPEAKDDEFKIPETIKTDIVRGDLFEIGPHRLLCGDSTSADDVAKLTNGVDINLIVTDPPYGVSYVGGTKDALEIQNDNLTEAQTHELWRDSLSAVWPFVKPGGSIYATVPPGPLHIGFAQALKDFDALRQIMVWNKDSLVLGRSDYHYKHEPILYGWKPGSAHYFIDDRTQTTVFDVPRPKANREHPTMKPVELWARFIQNSSVKNSVVYDPFLGSGTTMVAAHQLNRKCYGMEIDEKYCQVIVDRMLKLAPALEIKRNGKPYEYSDKSVKNGERG